MKTIAPLLNNPGASFHTGKYVDQRRSLNGGNDSGAFLTAEGSADCMGTEYSTGTDDIDECNPRFTLTPSSRKDGVTADVSKRQHGASIAGRARGAIFIPCLGAHKQCAASAVGSFRGDEVAELLQLDHQVASTEVTA